jgi:FHA domain
LDLSNARILVASCATDPTADWTIEQVLQFYLLQAQTETEEKYDQIETSLNQQFERGKNEIWALHKKVLEAGSKNSPIPSGSATTSSTNPQSCKIAREPTTIHVEIVGGFYAGTTYKLVPKTTHPCWVGRSSGKKFKERGISLSKDGEVSTTHGKFEVKQGKLYYTDAGSTNGSKVRGEDLPPETPFLLETGTELVLGQSIFKITLL